MHTNDLCILMIRECDFKKFHTSISTTSAHPAISLNRFINYNIKIRAIARNKVAEDSPINTNTL
jgi:hypothetical protein